MAQQALEAKQLVGQNRNRVHGQAQADLEPYRVYNLAPHRAGGYAPYGRRVRLQDATPADVTLSNIDRLLGYDETGISSFATTITGSGTLSLFRDTSIIVQGTASYTDPGTAVHLDAAGAYESRDMFLVLDREERAIEPTEVDVRSVSQAGAPGETYPVDGYGHFIDLTFGNDIFMAVTSGGYVLSSSDTGQTWDVSADYSAGLDGFGMEFRSIDFGNGIWIVCDEYFTILRSTDNGSSWSEVQVFSGYDRNDIDLLAERPWARHAHHVTGGTWYIVSDGGTFPSVGQAGILGSSDGGLTWASVEDLKDSTVSSTYEYAGTRIASNAANRVAAMMYEGKVWLDTTPNGIFGPADGNADSVSEWIGGVGYGWFWVGLARDRFIGLNRQTGQVAASASWENDPTDLRAKWTIATTLAGNPYQSAYFGDSASGTITVVGADGPNPTDAGRIWQGGEPGSLTRAEGLEGTWATAGGTAITCVAQNEAGVTVYGGYSPTGAMVMVADTEPGLQAGTYNLIYVAYANTPAGRLVFDFERDSTSFSSDEGNSISIQAQTKDEIIAANPWLDALDLADAQAIVDDFRLDVYIQYAATTSEVDEEDLGYSASVAENTIRYAFTVEFPDTAEPDTTFGNVGRTLGSLPIGRQLVTEGAPTTAVFEKSRTAAEIEPVRSRTALHNGRIWGLAAQDEDRWPQEDQISFEIANQFNRFVLTYTEVGWANLVSDQNFIPIQPTQSTNFTGLMSTPSGLMVMFDNEIFLVTGDPAFGNVAVDLYLDMVGCDVGTIPCKIGGLPFTIWNGKIWALQAGQAQEISRMQWRPEDPFIHICPEPQTRSLLAITSEGSVLRYLIDDQFWFTDPTTRDAFDPLVALPNFIDPDETDEEKGRCRIVDTAGAVWVTYADGTPDTPHIVYRDVDFGQPERRTPLYTAKVTLEGPLAQAEYDRDAGGYDANAIPCLFYGAANANNGDTHETFDAQTGGIQPVGNDPGSRSVQTLVFRAPLRQTRSYSLDLRFELQGMAYTDTLKLPVRLFYAAGGTTR